MTGSGAVVVVVFMTVVVVVAVGNHVTGPMSASALAAGTQVATGTPVVWGTHCGQSRKS